MSDEDKKPLTVVTSRVINNMIPPRKNKSRKVHVPTLLDVLHKDISFAEKIEAVRSVNPYFYLLTPKPKKAKGQK
tara:strand:+ start:1434 stop:1658 length:225 start_codon:yes stop_codon:yes gene_type:complete